MSVGPLLFRMIEEKVDPTTDEAVGLRYGDRMRREREEAGLSQREVAERLETSHTTVGKAERGDASEELLVELEGLYGMRAVTGPRHPLRRREWMGARNAGIQNPVEVSADG